MYLEKLEIQGFKSFANKNLLTFPGMLDKTKRGITAIVGPNGTGKSNVADAVRWTLGEQSMKMLRGKKGEDVIFSGSLKKGRLGMAEVSLYLNNEDRKAPIDYSEVVITRRLYRNGDSEYLINNSRVRLADIQMLLAKAKFGQKTYSVIGQGMVEGFLSTSLTERKEFFDEATGVKQFQIKRDDSLNKLRASYENLNQANMLLTEIDPRLKSLTRQVNKLRKREEFETELRAIQKNYYAKLWHDIHNKFNEYNKKFLEIEKVKLDKDKKIAALTRELNQMETDNQDLTGISELQEQLTHTQNSKDVLTKQLARLEVEREVKLEANGQFDLSWFMSKKDELLSDLAALDEEMNSLAGNIKPEKEKLSKLNHEKETTDKAIGELNQKLVSSTTLSDEDIEIIQKQIKESEEHLEKAELETDISKVKSLLRKVKQIMKEISLIAAKRPRQESLEKIHENLMELTKAKEEITTKINETNLRISARSERVKLLSEKKATLHDELTMIEGKLEKHGLGSAASETNKEYEGLKTNLEKTNQVIVQIKEKISNISIEEEAKRTRLFDLQKNIQSTQEEINSLNTQLNELKINSTRFETRLEDLEVEIRQNYKDLRAIKEHKAESEIDTETVLEKINSLKRQLDLIGGIDPEIEKEYNETKERYDFLSGQSNDLTKAIESLGKIVKELDLTIKERFDKEFKIIAKKFDEYFKIIFRGGHGKITKVMEQEKDDVEPEEKNAASGEETLESRPKKPQSDKFALINIKKIKFLQKHNATGLAGVEIQATPPGKKIKSISMLSGGERAMTAIALICAIISSNPSPFVVLDEVDAALDEANSERFAKILNDLSHKTQFIIITHNRATMRKANVLYGVTMGDDGVSKLLSIKLDEAKTINNK